jgi:hypothetical protein
MNRIKRILKTGSLATAAAFAIILHGPPAQAGSVIRLVYAGISTSADSNAVRDGLATLTNSAIFPGQPTGESQLDDFTGPAFGLQNSASGVDFGDWTRGYLEAPATGQYTFFLSSDDESELWLSSDTTAANRKLVAFERTTGPIYPSETFPLFSGNQIAERQSATVALTRGQKYYFEVLHKQGAGATYFQVGWRRPDGTQEIIPALHLAQFPVDPVAGTTVTNLAPTLNANGLNGGDLPPTVATNAGANLVFQLDVVAAQPTTITWTSNGVVIPGENLSYFQINGVSESANGATIQATVSNAFGVLPSTVSVISIAVATDTTSPVVVLADPAGNPNQVTVSYNKPVDPVSATTLGNYQLATAGGTPIAIQSATLLTNLDGTLHENTVQLNGKFDFIAGSNYVLTVRNVTDQVVPGNILAPNPTAVTFTNGSPAGITYTFDGAYNGGLDYGLQALGNAYVNSGGSWDGSSYLSLVDAQASQAGSLRFPGPLDVDQIHLQFKARIADGSSTPADGWSLTIAPDLPLAANSSAEQGWNPTVANPPRFIVAFETYSGGGNPIGVTVIVNGQKVTNVLAGVNGTPSIYDPDGNGDWVDYDFNLKRNGEFSLSWDGVTVIDRLQTGFTGINHTWVGLDARNGADFETIWLDNIVLNYHDGDYGPVSIAGQNQPASVAVNENAPLTLAVLPTGASPFYYQWFFNGEIAPGQTNRALRSTAGVGQAGAYFVVVSNSFSSVTSAVATVTVAADLTPPRIVSLLDAAGTLNEVQLVLSKPVDPATATNPATYSLGTLALLGATLGPDGETITLFTGPQTNGQTYALAISGLKDTAAAGNRLNTNTTFVASLNYILEVLADGPVRYWRFEETNGPAAASLASGFDEGPAAVNSIEQVDPGPTYGVPALLPSQPGSRALRLNAAGTNWLSVPNGSDFSANDGPWSKKSVEFWFNAASVPSPDSSGLQAAAGLWGEGAGTRAVLLYLWRDPNDPNTNEVSLIFHSYDGAADGAGSPYGLPAASAIYVQYSNIVAGQTYQVVGVYDGDPSDNFAGNLILYVNGVNVGEAGGIGQIYAHTGGTDIGRFNARDHTGADNGASGTFDGALDELSYYPLALSPARIAAHYLAGVTPPPVVATAPVIQSVALRNGSVIITWNGSATLQSADSATGPFTNVANAASPYSGAVSGVKERFFRLAQ